MDKPKVCSLTDTYEYLRRFNLAKSLYELSQLASLLKMGYENLNDLYKSNKFYPWVSSLSKSNRFSLIILIPRLIRFLILSGANDYKHKVLSLEDQSLFTALNMIMNLDEGPIGKLGKYMGRKMQQQRPLQTSSMELVSRSYFIYIKFAKSIEMKYDINEKMKEHYGITAHDFLIVGFVLWCCTNGEVIYNFPPKENKVKGVYEENIDLFVKILTLDYSEYRKHFRGVNTQKVDSEKEMLHIDPLILKPILKLGNYRINSLPPLIIPEPRYLLQKSTVGIFYLLADAERERSSHSNSNKFRESFGILYRTYVYELLIVGASNKTHIDLDDENDFKAVKNKKKPDFAIIHDNICLLIEVKTTLFKLGSRIYYDDTELVKDISSQNIATAIKQLDDFKNCILGGQIEDKRFSKIEHVIGLILGFDDVECLNSIILNHIKKVYAETITTHLQLGGALDIERLSNRQKNNQNIVEYLYHKVAHHERAAFAIVDDQENWNIEDLTDFSISKLGMEEFYNNFLADLSAKKYY